MAEIPTPLQRKIEALKSEIEALEREVREDIPAQMESAQAVGPVRENADLYLVADRAHYLQGRLRSLRERLRALQTLDRSRLSSDRAGYGSLLELTDTDSGAVRRVLLVSPEEVDGSGETCSLASPLGRALAGKRVGDEVEVRTPGGTRLYRIETITI